MIRRLTPMLTRRLVTTGAFALLAGGAAAQRSLLLPTPSATAGPFYPAAFPEDSDADLVVLRGSATQALGVVTHLTGRVLTPDGMAVPSATVEIWQCDANGRYHHPADREGRARDPGFQGYGRVMAGADGHYGFRTIRPVAYPGRTPHIHVAVRAPGRRPLVTQMYVAGDPSNAADFLYRSLDSFAARAVTVAFGPANGIEAGALAGQFDIVLA